MKLIILICFVSVWCSLAYADSSGSNRDDSEESNEILDESQSNESNLRSPIVLVPGLTISRLEAQVDSTFKWPHWYCQRGPYNGGWFTFWASVTRVLQPECWYSVATMRLNSARNGTENAPGVRVRPYKFGSTKGVEYLDSLHLTAHQVMHDLVKALTRKLGYRKNIDLFAAPYDWRKSPEELEESLFEPMRQLIEQASKNNSNQAVTLMAHSMGCPVALLFLNRQTEQWRSQYIRRFVSISGPYLGTMISLTAILFGDEPIGRAFLPLTRKSRTYRSFSSFAFLFPNWQDQSSHNLLVTADGSYSARNLTTMLSRTNLTDFKRLYQLTRPDAQRARDLAPQVDTWCLYSNGVPTPEQVLTPNTKTADLPQYEQRKFKYEKIKGDGDGLVSSVSLQWCRQWSDRQSAPVRYQTFSGIKHQKMIMNPKVIDFIVKRVLSQ